MKAGITRDQCHNRAMKTPRPTVHVVMQFILLMALLSVLVGHVIGQNVSAPMPLMTVVNEFPHDELVTDVALTPDGKHALTLTQKGLHIWALRTAALEQTVTVKDVRYLRHLDVSDDGSHVALSDGKTVVLLEATTWTEKQRFSAEVHQTLTFSPDGSFLLLGGASHFRSTNDQDAVLWNLTTNTLEHRLKVTWQDSAVAFSQDGNKLIAGSYRGVAVHDARTGKRIQWLDGVSGVALSVDGGRVASTGRASRDMVQGIRVWSIDDAELIVHIPTQVRFADLILIDEGRRLLTSGTDVRLWDVATGKELSWSFVDGVQPHKGIMGRIAVSRDERLVLAADDHSLKEDVYMARVFSLAGDAGVVIPPPYVAGPTAAPVSPLILAARAEDDVRVRSLLARGIKADVVDGYGKTPLHYARSTATVRMLLAHGAEVNALGKSHETPLYKAIESHVPRLPESLEVIELLVAKGADVNMRRRGMFYGTPIQRAAQRGQRDLVDWLRSKGAYYDPISVLLLDDIDHLEQEISAGRFDPVSFRMAYGRKTLLHEARSAAAVDVLLKHGSGLEILDAWKSTPLLAALGNNRPEVARALTKHGANTEVRTSTGKSVEEMWKWFDSN